MCTLRQAAPKRIKRITLGHPRLCSQRRVSSGSGSIPDPGYLYFQRQTCGEISLEDLGSSVSSRQYLWRVRNVVRLLYESKSTLL